MPLSQPSTAGASSFWVALTLGMLAIVAILLTALTFALLAYDTDRAGHQCPARWGSVAVFCWD